MKAKSKAEKEKAAKAALRRRITDILSGAAGRDFDQESEISDCEMLSKAIPALRELFLCEEEGKKNKYLFEPHCLDHYDTVDSITEFFWRNGVRA